MRRELIIVATLLAIVGVACGGSKSAAPSVPRPEQTEAPAVTPTSTPPLESPERPEPPLVTLDIAGNEQIAGLGSYCWRYENGAPFCADWFDIPTAQEALSAESPLIASLRLPVERPVTESQLNVYPVTVDDQVDREARGLRWWRPKSGAREQFTLALESETIVELSLEPGLYVLSLFARWQGYGSASYGFLVEVR